MNALSCEFESRETLVYAYGKSRKAEINRGKHNYKYGAKRRQGWMKKILAMGCERRDVIMLRVCQLWKWIRKWGCADLDVLLTSLLHKMQDKRWLCSVRETHNGARGDTVKHNQKLIPQYDETINIYWVGYVCDVTPPWLLPNPN